MNALNAAMTVIGAGSYGTALLHHPGKKWLGYACGAATRICDAAARPLQRRISSTFLSPTRCIWKAIWRPRWRPAAISSSSCRAVFGQVLRQIKPLMRPDARLVWATKVWKRKPGACCRTYCP